MLQEKIRISLNILVWLILSSLLNSQLSQAQTDKAFLVPMIYYILQSEDTDGGSTPDFAKRPIFNGFNLYTDKDFLIGPPECGGENSIVTEPGENFTTFTHIRGNNLRCELAIQDLMPVGKPFRIKFEFKMNSYFPLTTEWHSIFQVHSFPDEDVDEVWRCPIMALAMDKGKLSMYNHYDLSYKSIPGLYNCDDDNPATTIQTENFVTDVEYSITEWNTFEMYGTLSLTDDECLTVKINTTVNSYCGPNTFNDARRPFLKFGIYKPTSWQFYNQLSVAYRNVSFE